MESSKRNLSCELDVNSSEYDSRKFHVNHGVLLTIVIFIIIFMGGSLLLTLNSENQIKKSFSTIASLNIETLKSEITILRLKLLFSDVGHQFIKYLIGFNILNSEIKNIEEVSTF